MVESTQEGLPSQVVRVLEDPIGDREGFYEYVQGRIAMMRSVRNRDDPHVHSHIRECTVLLAGLDRVGRAITRDIEKRLSGDLDRLQAQMVCYEYLADELRAIRRTAAATEIRWLDEDGPAEDFLKWAVLPLLTRLWLPAAWYEPFRDSWRPDLPAGADSSFYKMVFADPSQYSRRLESVPWDDSLGPTSFERVLVGLTCSGDLGTGATQTASYLWASSVASKAGAGGALEVPVLIVPAYLSDSSLAHIARILVVPFEVPCTMNLKGSSFVDAVTAAADQINGDSRRHMSDHLLVGDYPGGVSCPGLGRCSLAEEVSRKPCEDYANAFHGPSAGLSLAALLTAAGLGVEMHPNVLATAGIKPDRQTKALRHGVEGNENLDLKAKGRTVALLGRPSISGLATVIVADSGDRDLLSEGARRVPNGGQSVTCETASSLREAIGLLTTSIYDCRTASVTSNGRFGHPFARAAANKVVKSGGVHRWAVLSPPDHDADGTSQPGFEEEFARQIRDQSRSRGKPVAALCLDALQLWSGMQRHVCGDDWLLGLAEVTAELSSVDLSADTDTRRARIRQIKNDLSDGHLVVVLTNLHSLQARQVLSDLRLGLNSDTSWANGKVVATVNSVDSPQSRQLLALLKDRGFQELRPPIPRRKVRRVSSTEGRRRRGDK